MSSIGNIIYYKAELHKITKITSQRILVSKLVQQLKPLIIKYIVPSNFDDMYNESELKYQFPYVEYKRYYNEIQPDVKRLPFDKTTFNQYITYITVPNVDHINFFIENHVFIDKNTDKLIISSFDDLLDRSIFTFYDIKLSNNLVRQFKTEWFHKELKQFIKYFNNPTKLQFINSHDLNDKFNTYVYEFNKLLNICQRPLENILNVECPICLDVKLCQIGHFKCQHYICSDCLPLLKNPICCLCRSI
jgi:hypothetical protein